MRPLIFYASLIFILLGYKASGQQAVALTMGRIVFEKRVNMYSYLESGDGSVYDQFATQYKKDNPQFVTSQFNLFFQNRTTLYKPVTESKQKGGGLFQNYYDANNTVFTDLNKHVIKAQKSVFEETFLLSDSIRNLKWKITDEIRTIAGFECRRANAIMMDSLLVVAFYAPSIQCEGGPESFSGLPGMILGVAVPSKHITWFATNIYVHPDEEITAPKEGKLVNHREFSGTLETILKAKVTNVKQIKELIEL